jgi:hypothetical protein
MQFGSEGEKSVSTEEEDHTRRNGCGFEPAGASQKGTKVARGLKLPLSRPFRRLDPAGVPGRARV